ncbi:MAG: hypothetical protein A2086_00465 [Spirochaetes bacterium GWD1_27_9]|nr:MAG: hypothetical protein A2Z98_08655 [Spirochaetes bacterium GWB1_27_13]OHD22165.1 MAG: hypothetical protein A2Y34_16000 [Spirochaetes bacterium GWC1_27_15]OHD37255.1 MAG: hypothetical protein A2086_00465 [Spirochaetes bacterium GWD1_27_9]
MAEKKNAQFIKDGKVQIFCGDFKTHNFAGAGIYNKILFVNVIYFWDNLTECFKKINDLLISDGIVIFYMVAKENLLKTNFTNTEVFNKYAIEDIKKILKDLNFKNIEYETINLKSRTGYLISAKKI